LRFYTFRVDELKHKVNLFVYGERYTHTWCEEAVEVTDNCSEGGPECGLVVHAAGNQISQFGPLWRREVQVILVELDFL